MALINFDESRYKLLTNKVMSAYEMIGGLKHQVETLQEENKRLHKQLNKSNKNYPLPNYNMHFTFKKTYGNSKE